MTISTKTFNPTFKLGGAKAFCTNRHGGLSTGNFASLNLATHVGDDLAKVAQNRAILQEFLQAELAVDKFAKKPAIVWLDQQHTNRIVYADKPFEQPPVADAVWTDQPDLVLAVLTADCLPILLADSAGKVACAIHAGWRGLVAGIVQNSIAALPVEAGGLTAWIGPAISQPNFQVGAEVRAEFLQQNQAFAVAFKPDFSSANNEKHHEKYLADLPLIAEMILRDLGVQQIEQSNICTFANQDYFSYRRNRQTGRIASLVYFNQQR